MSYNYRTQRPNIFTEEGQVMFLKIRDRAKYLLDQAGAVQMERLLAVTTGDTWDMQACVDRLVELGEIREVQQAGPVAGQHHIFTKP